MSTTESSKVRVQRANLDTAVHLVQDESHSKWAHTEGAPADKSLGLVWVITSYPLVAAGLEKALEHEANVRIGATSFAGSPSCVVLCVDGMRERFLDDMRRVRELYPDVPLLVFASHLDPALALGALKNGAAGYVHAGMEREQLAKAVEVAENGELAAPRQLLPYLLSQDGIPEVGGLTVRQREVLEIVAEDVSNAEIARRLYVSESTIKQHLRAAYKLLGVRNRSEAAKIMRKYARAL